MDRKIKLKDIAREAGVSISTVSRALNNKDTVSNATRNMIYDVINKYDSHHNQTRKLNKIRKILVLTANLSHLMHIKVLESINDTAEKRGYRIIIEITNNQLLSYEELHQRVIETQASGVIVLSIMAKIEALEQLNRVVPVIYSSKTSDPVAFSTVGTHLFTAYKSLMSYLISQGKKHIGVLFPMRYVDNSHNYNSNESSQIL